MKRKAETRSPIKDLPVRQAGQSLREQSFETVYDHFLTPVAVCLAMALATIFSWTQYFQPKSRSFPVIVSVFFVGTLVYALVSCRRALKRADQMRLGRIGEEAVAQYLEEKLRPSGASVLNDILGDGFNLDHVVIAPSGIYCIETKTHSKRKRDCGEVVYDGESVTVDGFKPDRDPIVQAKAGAHWLQGVIEKSTGKRFKVQPVVLYPGWWVKSSVQWPEVWVMNEKALVPTIQKSRDALSETDQNLVTYHLKRYVIAKTEELRAAKS
jgi:hypothetical protein